MSGNSFCDKIKMQNILKNKTNGGNCSWDFIRIKYNVTKDNYLKMIFGLTVRR